jgi:hypothetical protein
LVDFTLKTFLGGIGLLGGDHLDEAEAARLLGVGIAHNVSLLDLAVLLEETRDLLLGEGRVDACDEEVGALVAAALVVLFGTRCWGRTTARLSARVYRRASWSNVPAVATIPTIGRSAAGT